MKRLYGFPIFLPGETIYSAVTRYHRLSAASNVSSTLDEVFGKHTRTLTSDLPCCLGELADVLGLELLINQHTMLPLFAPFLGAQRLTRVRDTMLGNSGIGLKMSMGITAAGFERYKVRRFCPQCLSDDYNYFGVSYWHVIHQASGVFVCPFHGCALFKAPHEPHHDINRHLCLPSDSIVVQSAVPYVLSPVQLTHMTNLSRLLEWSYWHPDSVLRLVSSNFLRSEVERRGYYRTGRLDHKALSAKLAPELEMYPFEDECLRLKGRVEGFPVWPYELLKPARNVQHPLYFFCMLDLLHSTTEVIESFLRNPPPRLMSSMPVHPSARCPDQSELMKRRIAFIEEAKTIGARRTSGYWWLYRYDKEWLSSHLARMPKQRAGKIAINWVERDEQMVAKINQSAFALRHILGKPIKITLAALARQIGLPLDTFRNPTRLPLAFDALDALTESEHQFQSRKVLWAVADLDAQGLSYSRSMILRRAAIRNCHLTEDEIFNLTTISLRGSVGTTSKK